MELNGDVHLKNSTENIDKEKIRLCSTSRMDLESISIAAEEAEGSIDSNQMKEITVVGDSFEMKDEVQKQEKIQSKNIVENISIDGVLRVEAVSQVSSSENEEKVGDLKTKSESTTNKLSDHIDSVSNSEIVSEEKKLDKIMDENIAVDSKVLNDSENNLIVENAKENKSSNNNAKVVSLELLGDSKKKSIQIDCDSGFEFSSAETSISNTNSVQNVSFELFSSSLDKTKKHLSDVTACVSTTESNLVNINTDYESPDKLTRTLLTETSDLLKLQTNISNKKSSKNESILCKKSIVSNADLKTDAIENEVIVPFKCLNDDPDATDDFAYESEVYEEVEAASDCESGEDKYSGESLYAVVNSSEETHHEDKIRKMLLHTADKYIEKSLHTIDKTSDNSLHTVDKSSKELFHTININREESLDINKSNDESLHTVDKSNNDSIPTVDKSSDESVLKAESLSFVAVSEEINDNITMAEHSSISNIEKDVPGADIITEDLLILSEAEESEGDISNTVLHEANTVMNEEKSKDINHSREKSDSLKQDSDSDFDLDDDAIMGLEKDVSSSPVIQKNILQGNLIEKISQELPVVPDTLSKIISTDFPSNKKTKDLIPVLCLDSDDDLNMENINDLSSDDDCCIVEDTRNEVIITDEEKATQAEIVPFSVQQENKDMSNNKPDLAKKSNENVSFTQTKSIEPMSRGQKRKLSTEQSTVPVSVMKQSVIIDESQVTVSNLLASIVGEVGDNKNKVTSSSQGCVEKETVNDAILNSGRKENTDINSKNNASQIDNDIIVETVIKKKSDPTELISSISDNKSIKRTSSEIHLSPEAISSKRIKENELISSSVSNLLNITNMPNSLKSKASNKVPLADPFMIQTKKSYLDKIAFHLCKTTLDGLNSSEIDYAKKITRDLEEKLHLLKVRCQPLKEQMAVLCRSQHKIAQEHGLILQKPIRTVGIQVSIKLEVTGPEKSHKVTGTEKSHEPLSNCKPMSPKAPPVVSITSSASNELQPPIAQPLSLIQTSPTTMSQRFVVNSAYRPQTPIPTARATFGNVISPNVTMTGNPLSAVMRSMGPTTTSSNRGRPTNASRALARLPSVPAVPRPNTYAPANQQNVLISPNNQQNILLSPANQQNVLLSSGNQQNFLVPISSLLQLNGRGVQNNRPTIVSSLPQNFLGKTMIFSPGPLNNNGPQGTSPQMQTVYLRVTNPNQVAGMNNVINTVPRAATTTTFAKHPRAAPATAPNPGPRPRTAQVTLHNPGVRPRTAPVTAQNPGLVLYPQHAIKHPAPFPRPPMYSQNPMLKDMPPPPTLKGNIAPNNGGIILSWSMSVSPRGHAEVATYQLYAYQENPRLPISASLWKKVGDVKALPLPMACTLTQFVEGNRYYFTVRAVDVHTRIGQNSDPVSVLFSKDGS